jgi:ABC-type sugar transport system ATPase subunit
MLGIRPEHVNISDNHGIPAELVSGDYLGGETVITARIGGQEILIRAAGRIRVTKPIAALLSWSDRDVHVFNAKSGKRDDKIEALAV